MSSKPPVSILRELCTKLNISENYNVESSSGPSNDPVFVMSVETSTGLKAVGKGKKKKEAQHKAAQALLDIMKSKGLYASSEVGVPSPYLPVEVASAISSDVNKEGSSGTYENAVGRLQEYCMSHGWSLPNYSCVDRMGDDHQPAFTMKCELQNISATGTSRTKKQAKQEAAHMLYQKLVAHSSVLSSSTTPAPPVPTPTLTVTEKEAIMEKYSLCKPLPHNIPQSNPSLKFGAYHTSLQASLSIVTDELKQETFVSPVKTLESITKKLRVTISYHEGRDIVPNNPENEKCFVYAIVTTQPTTVQIGHGHSNSAATVEAALSVLKYWQKMLGIYD